jgi:DNA modification methylase
MSLRKKIVELLNSKGEKMSMKDIYTNFPEIAKTTVRGRVYDSLGKGIQKIGKGLYISAQAVIEHGNSLEIIDRLAEEGEVFDCIFLDIPYAANGQKGGNRNLFACDTISVEEFGTFVQKLEGLLKTENSPLFFMFTSGKTSKSAHDKYMSQFNKTSLKKCDKFGTYTKLWGNGNRMNMGKFLMPEENIYVFSKSGIVDNIEDWEFDFRMTPDLREYPTAKPYGMIKRIIEQATKIGDWILDPFAGSGKTLQACIELKRMCYAIDSSEKSFNNHLLPLISF